MGLGQQVLGRDAGFVLPVRIWTDSSAAMGTAARQGLGKMRHLECHSLWVQQRLRRREFELRKVLGTENPADLFTKHMDSANKLGGLVDLFGCEFREGRPHAAPHLKRVRPVATSAGNKDVQGAPALTVLVHGPHSEQGSACDRLPHLTSQAEMDKMHPPAEPDDPP